MSVRFNPDDWYSNPVLPRGRCWKCPDCDSWASLPENAGYHMVNHGHGLPFDAEQPPLMEEEEDYGDPPKDGSRILVHRVLGKYDPQSGGYKDSGTQWVEAYWDPKGDGPNHPDGMWREWLGTKRSRSTGDGFKVIDWRPLPC